MRIQENVTTLGRFLELLESRSREIINLEDKEAFAMYSLAVSTAQEVMLMDSQDILMQHVSDMFDIFVEVQEDLLSRVKRLEENEQNH